MDDVQENSVIQEVAPLKDHQNHSEMDSAQQENNQSEVSRPDTRQNGHFSALRKSRDEAVREAKLQKELNERLLERLSQFQPQSVPQEIDELDNIPEDDFLNKGKNKKLVKKEIEPLRKEIEDLKKQINAQNQYNHVDRLKRQYSDFDQIVNADTLAILEQTDPELASTIADHKDPYKILSQSYKYIKALNLHKDVVDTPRSKEVDKRIEKNNKTLPSPQSFDKRPMAQAFRMSETQKKEIHDEMVHYARQAGFSY